MIEKTSGRLISMTALPSRGSMVMIVIRLGVGIELTNSP